MKLTGLEPDRELFTVGSLSIALGVTRATVYDWIGNGRIVPTYFYRTRTGSEVALFDLAEVHRQNGDYVGARKDQLESIINHARNELGRLEEE